MTSPLLTAVTSTPLRIGHCGCDTYQDHALLAGRCPTRNDLCDAALIRRPWRHRPSLPVVESDRPAAHTDSMTADRETVWAVCGDPWRAQHPWLQRGETLKSRDNAIVFCDWNTNPLQPDLIPRAPCRRRTRKAHDDVGGSARG